MNEAPQDPAKKIIIDEDWKTQVQRERDAARHEPPTPEPSPTAEKGPSADEDQVPPASLTFLVSSLSMQAAASMGLIPNPVSGTAEVSLPHAKHFIDTIEILQQKTEGNRTPDESDEMEAMLHQLRMAFVQVSR